MHHKEIEISAKKESRVNLGHGIEEVLTFHPVEKPKHYNTGKVECIEAIEAALSQEEFLGYLRGSVLKYQWRCRYKGKDIEDVDKSIWYANLLREKLGAYKNENSQS